MLRKEIIFIFNCLLPIGLLGQTYDFSQVEKEKFVEVYLGEKESRIKPDTLLTHTLADLDISIKEYKKLYSQRNAQDSRLLLQKIKEESQIMFYNRQEIILDSLIKKHKMTISRYLLMLDTYKKHPTFQQELKSIFITFYNKEKK